MPSAWSSAMVPHTINRGSTVLDFQGNLLQLQIVDLAGDQAKTGSMPLPYASCHVRVATRRLTPLDEHILLGSETFWSLVSPGDAALRSHLHLKVSASALLMTAALGGLANSLVLCLHDADLLLNGCLTPARQAERFMRLQRASVVSCWSGNCVRSIQLCILLDCRTGVGLSSIIDHYVHLAAQ